MRYQKISLTAFITLILTISMPIAANLPALFQMSQVLAQTPADRKAEADRLLKQGVEQGKTNQLESALQSFQQALIIYREIKDRKGERYALSNLGLTYFDRGEYRKTIYYSEQALAIAKEIKDPKREGRELGTLGLAYDILGDYPKAIKYHEQHWAIAKKMNDPEGQSRALSNLGVVYGVLGEYPKAINYFLLGLRVAVEANNPKFAGQLVGNIGIAYRKLGDYPKAIEFQKAHLAIARKNDDREGEGAALLNLGNAYSSLGDYPNAIKSYQQSLAIATQIKDPQKVGMAVGNIGGIYLKLEDYKKAIEYIQQDVTIARKIKDRKTEGEALSSLGFAFYKQGNLTLAESTLIEAMKVRESLRGGLKDNEEVSIFDTQTNTYETLQQVLIAQNKINAALEIAERGRARALVKLLASRSSSNKTEQFGITPSNIEQIKQIAKLQNATLVQYSITYDDFKIQDKSQTKESELYIWVIKPTGEVTFRKSDLKPLWQKDNINLANLVTTSRNSIGARGRAGGILVSDNPDAPKAKQRLQRLHELLIKPIADLLPSKESDRVIFIPQSSLFLVPFPALRDGNGKYLIEKHTILTAPSIQVLDLTKKQRQNLQNSPINALVLGNPTMPSMPPKPGEKPQPLPPLPGAEKEALAIAPLLNTKAITGSQGTKAAIVQKMPRVRIIHLATHGLLDDDRGLGSAIALAPDSSPPKPGEINGLLTAEEILAMKLQAELVVLSACDTGRGRITGDGVIGLSRSLISAGVPSVMVSLWSVPDAPTAELMTQFYKNFLQRKLDKAIALREAMLTTMKTHPNPRDWAAFTLIGESE